MLQDWTIYPLHHHLSSLANLLHSSSESGVHSLSVLSSVSLTHHSVFFFFPLPQQIWMSKGGKEACADFPKCSRPPRVNRTIKWNSYAPLYSALVNVQSIFLDNFVPKLESGQAGVCVRVCYWTRKHAHIAGKPCWKPSQEPRIQTFLCGCITNTNRTVSSFLMRVGVKYKLFFPHTRHSNGIISAASTFSLHSWDQE